MGAGAEAAGVRRHDVPEVGGLAFGGWEDNTKGFGRKGIPHPFAAELLPPDFDRFEPLGAAAVLRRNLLIYGLGGVVVPFVGIKLIDVVLTLAGLA